jgi:hypothetical protein
MRYHLVLHSCLCGGMIVSLTAQYNSQFIQIFSELLPVNWTLKGEPQIVPNEITPSHIRKFQHAYKDLVGSTLCDAAITDMDLYQDTTGRLQTTGVGLADDFNHFTNLGLLLGDRVVLWDTMIRGTFFPPGPAIDENYIAQLSGELLSLAPVIKEGGILMLPHPSAWLERWRKYAQAVQGIDGITPAFMGFLNAQALRDEGINLHPYTLSDQPTDAYSIGGKSSITSGRERKDENATRDFMMHIQFDYLKDLDTTRLHGFLKGNSQWRSGLSELLRVPDNTNSQADINRHMAKVMAILQEGIESQNRSFGLEKLNLTKTGVSCISCAIGLAPNSFEMATVLGALGIGLELSHAWLSFCRSRSAPNDNKVMICQGFKKLRHLYDEQQADLYNPLDPR